MEIVNLLYNNIVKYYYNQRYRYRCTQNVKLCCCYQLVHFSNVEITILDFSLSLPGKYASFLEAVIFLITLSIVVVKVNNLVLTFFSVAFLVHQYYFCLLYIQYYYYQNKKEGGNLFIVSLSYLECCLFLFHSIHLYNT